MKKILLFVVAITMMIALLQLPTVLGATALKVSVSKYEPYPVAPGQTVKVWFLVQNLGSDDGKDITVELLPQYPYTLYGDSATKKIAVLGGYKDYLVDYTLKVDDHAQQGLNIFKVRLFFNGVEQTTELSLDVQSRDTAISIIGVKTEPAQIAPGSDATITISVKNMAPVPLTNVNMNLHFYTLVGTSVVDLPFAPVDSGSEQLTYKLNAGESYDFVYHVRVYPDAKTKVYKIPLIMSYYDSTGAQKNTTDNIGVVVNTIPEVTVLVDRTDLTTDNKYGVVTLKFVNKGLTDIKFLNVVVQKSDDFDLLSVSDTTYIGNLVSDDFQTTEYQISAKKDVLAIPVLLQYRDANNNYYEKTEIVAVNLLSDKDLQKAQGKGSSVAMIVVVIIIIAGAVWIFVRNRNKKNKKAQF